MWDEKDPGSERIQMTGIGISSDRMILGAQESSLITYIRFPDCSSCGGTTASVLERVKDMGPVIVGLDVQPKYVRGALAKKENVVIMEWNSLPKAWKKLLPGIYKCNLIQEWCKQIEG